jgi:glycosyltransferase involved in cell wall biosynthesis
MVQIAVGLMRRGFDVIAVVGSSTGGTAAALRKAGVPFVALEQPLLSSSRLAAAIGSLPLVGKLRGVIDLAALLKRSLALARVFRDHQVDIVHSHLVPSMVMTRIAGALARVPIRVSMIASPLHLESPKLRKLDAATYRLDDRILAGCQFTKDLYRELGFRPEKVTTVGYGIDPFGYDPSRADGSRVRRELGIAETDLVVGQVAFFYPVLGRGLGSDAFAGRGIKGHEDLLAAARLVLDVRSDARFLVVGDGFGSGGERHFEEIKRLAGDLGLDGAMIFTGRRADLADVIAAFDVSVQCSVSENYGGTIESLLMERPLIATRAGGMPEVVIDGETGVLVPARDPQCLAEAMLNLLSNPKLGQRLGRTGRQRMLVHHTIQKTTDEVVQVYREIAELKGIQRAPLGLGHVMSRADATAAIGLMPRDVLFTEGR